jgi:phosphoglycolate phosphatase-like HAD superfamily hydrolase
MHAPNGSPVRVLNSPLDARGARVALFDFDGTLSLIRSGWMEVMVPMMVEVLVGLGTGESPEDLEATVRDFVTRLTGKQTIYQMIELARQVEARAARPAEPQTYKRMYLDRLWSSIRDRVEALERGVATPGDYLVPGSMELLAGLRERGFVLYLASGTDDADVKREAELLRLTPFFGERIFGAQEDYKTFSKAILMRNILNSTGFKGEQFLAFGDGYVEIQNVKDVGGTAVGVATREPECREFDTWKCERLAGVGADCLVPNYLCLQELFQVLNLN